jgi:hypothetical protein
VGHGLRAARVKLWDTATGAVIRTFDIGDDGEGVRMISGHNPGAKAIGFLVNPNDPNSLSDVTQAQEPDRPPR